MVAEACIMDFVLIGNPCNQFFFPISRSAHLTHSELCNFISYPSWESTKVQGKVTQLF